jgi:hypothetical protein
MMSASRDEEERLAEILREILALSGAKRPNQSPVANDSIKVFDPQCVNGLDQASAPCGEQASEKRSTSED